jgi:tRNA (adenine22-N1)-methyltransferase
MLPGIGRVIPVRLQERLRRMVKYVPAGSVVADIGTDHGLLPAYLVSRGICGRVIATDLNEGPLSTARSTVGLFGLGKAVEFRQGDGLEVIRPGEADVVVIAGMGGVKINDIMARAQDTLQQVRRLILQPLGAAPQVRRWLVSNGWRLADEDLVLEDGHFYEIIVAERQAPDDEPVTGLNEPEYPSAPASKERPERFEIYVPPAMKHQGPEFRTGSGAADSTDFSLEIGPRLLEKRHPLLISFLTEQIGDMESVLIALRRARTPAARQRKKEWARRVAYFKGVLQEMKACKSKQPSRR